VGRAAADDVALTAQALLGPTQFQAQFGQIGAAAVLELDALQVVPDALIRVQLGRIARQALQMQALGRPRRQEVLDRLPFVDGGPIPDDEHLAADLAQQHPQKADHRLGGVRLLLHLQKEAPVQGDATDD
jgi:hypothetical protein